jgi:phosphate uptake regulator
MKRRVIKQGYNTFTISLPKKWCDSHELSGRDEIDVSEKGNCLLLSKEAYKGAEKISVDVTGLNRATIILLVESLYNYGYSLITVTTKDKSAKDTMHHKDISMPSLINICTSRLIGAEIISSSPNLYTIEVITEDSKEKFEVVLRRIFRLIIELFELFVEGIRKRDKAAIESIEFKHITIKRFSNYALRLLNKFGHEEANKTTFYFAIVCFLSKIDEIVKNFAAHTISEGRLDLSKGCSDMIEEVGNAFKLYYSLFYKYDLSQLSKLHEMRDALKNKLYIEKYKSLEKDDVFILSGITQALDALLDLSELRMAIGYN